jgi:hypothetical protein
MSDKPNRRGSRSGGPTRTQSDLADVVELLLDKGIVINADIAVSIGDAELLGIQLRAAIASFETAAKYGLEFPSGTDTDRIEEIAEATSIDDEGEDDELAVERSSVGDRVMGLHEPPISESSPAMEGPPITESDEDDGGDETSGDSSTESDGDEDAESENSSSGTVEAVGDAVSSDHGSGGSEPGVRQRPTAPDVDTEDGTADAETANREDSSENRSAGTNAGADETGEDTEDEQ